MTDKDQPAFAAMTTGTGGTRTTQTGLTKREYFAAMALQGMLSNNDAGKPTKDGRTPMEALIEVSVKLSDALINELNKTK